MQGVRHVTWRVSPLTSPRIRRYCDHCKQRRPFECSGKFRSNAQKKRIDVWLIYRCGQCDTTWTRPIHERRSLADIDPAELQAFAASSAEAARRHAFDLAGLQRQGGDVEPASEVAVEKRAPPAPPRDPSLLVITIALAAPCALRLERLLARELGLSRGRLQALHRAESLVLSPAGRRLLRQPVRDGQSVTLHLARLPDLAASILERAAG